MIQQDEMESINVDDKIQELLEEVQFYMEVEIWDEINFKLVKNWLDNFETEDEKKLAYVILSNLIFYSKNAIRSFYEQIFYIVIKNSLPQSSLGYQVSLGEWERLHTQGKVSDLKLRYTVIDGVDNLVGKSGQSIIRDFQRNLRIHKRFLVSANNLSSLNQNVECIIILDDFLGTGDQFNGFHKKYLKDIDTKVVFIPLAATREGMRNVELNCDNVTVLPVDLIDESYNVIEKAKEIFGESYGEDWVFKTVKKLLQKNKIKISENLLLGKGGQALSYASCLSTPNNNISLLWLESDLWKNLLRR